MNRDRYVKYQKITNVNNGGRRNIPELIARPFKKKSISA